MNFVIHVQPGYHINGTYMIAVAYLGFHFGGGGRVQKFSGKVEVFAWREATRL